MTEATSSWDPQAHRRSKKPATRLFGGVGRFLLAEFLTVLLLVFLASLRLIKQSDAALLSLRSLDRLESVSIPAPPPPPVETPPDEPPPPEPPPPLPQLAIQLDTVAPPIKASPVRKVKMRMQVTSFAPESEPQMQTMTFYASDLDSPPRLVNRPSATYPSSQLRRGVREGRVVLEVMIQSNGVVQVRRVLESSHEDFTKMARAFATRARFTSPQKDGRSVNAVFRWPLILRP